MLTIKQFDNWLYSDTLETTKPILICKAISPVFLAETNPAFAEVYEHISQWAAKGFIHLDADSGNCIARKMITPKR